MATHDHCTHPATSAARAACRKARAQVDPEAARGRAPRRPHRDDVHRAVELVTEDYTEAGYYDLGTTEEKPYLTELNAAIKAHGWHPTAPYQSASQCDHCGARIRYGVCMLHTDGGIICVGERCADNRFPMAAARFQEMRKAAALNRDRKSKADRFAGLCEQHPHLVWLTYLSALEGETVTEVDELDGYEYTRHTPRSVIVATQTGKQFSILSDLYYKMHKYGNPSEAQIDLAARLLSQIEERWTKAEARMAERDAEREAAQPAPSGRVVVTGEIVHTKWVEGEDHFGRPTHTHKMMIKADGGYRVWVTMPMSLSADKGDRVSIKATLTISDDDQTFAFGKRPTVIEHVPAAV